MTEQKNALMVPTTAPLTISGDMPAYLVDYGKTATGLEDLGKSDFKIPEIKLIQGMSPEVTTYKGVAVVGEYFHTGLMKSLGTSFRSVLCVIKKRAVLWRPKSDQGGGILAVSDDCVHWKTGANQEFSVMLKGAKKPVIWKTKSNVIESGLLEFGTQDPESEKSPPAAVEYYEYIHYLPDYEHASPAVSRVKSTALDNAKKLNSYFLMQGKPIYVHALQWVTEEKKGDDGGWTIPLAKPIGFVDRATFEITKEMNAQYSGISLDIQQEPENAPTSDSNSPAF
jgi:hypothetical protein